MGFGAGCVGEMTVERSTVGEDFVACSAGAVAREPRLGRVDGVVDASNLSERFAFVAGDDRRGRRKVLLALVESHVGREQKHEG